jgi:uncharacterized delta-60 repeat protein
VQTDGKIVIAGTSWNTTEYSTIVVRYNNDGSLDTNFGTAGVVTYKVQPDQGDWCNKMILQPDGKILVAGVGGFGSFVARLNTDGRTDTAFGTDGVVLVSGLYCQGVDGLSVDAEEKILISGSSGNTAVVMRYNSDGTLDTTFATNGVDALNGPHTTREEAMAITTQTDGKIVVVGKRTNGLPCTDSVMIWRYNSDGSPDSMFGVDGLSMYNNSSHCNDVGSDVAIEENGKIVVAGYRYGNYGQNFLVLRVNGDVPLTVLKSGSGNGSITSGTGKINCGSVCSHDLPYNTNVTLTASPDSRSVFAGWTGCDSVSGNDCTISMNEPEQWPRVLMIFLHPRHRTSLLLHQVAM